MACKSSTLCDGDGGDGPRSADSIMRRLCLEDNMAAHCEWQNEGAAERGRGKMGQRRWSAGKWRVVLETQNCSINPAHMPK